MSEEQASKLRRPLMVLAWIVVLYGVVLLLDYSDQNDTAGWILFLVPILIVVGERITRGDDEEEEDDEPAAEGDDPSSPAP